MSVSNNLTESLNNIESLKYLQFLDLHFVFQKYCSVDLLLVRRHTRTHTQTKRERERKRKRGGNFDLDFFEFQCVALGCNLHTRDSRSRGGCTHWLRIFSMTMQNLLLGFDSTLFTILYFRFMMDLRPLTTLFFSSFSFKVNVGEKHESYALTHTSGCPLSHANRSTRTHEYAFASKSGNYWIVYTYILLLLIVVVCRFVYSRILCVFSFSSNSNWFLYTTTTHSVTKLSNVKITAAERWANDLCTSIDTYCELKMSTHRYL